MSDKWKVIGIDNLDRESTSDILIEENLTEEQANIKASKMNSETDDYAPWYYKAVLQEYKLYTFEP